MTSERSPRERFWRQSPGIRGCDVPEASPALFSEVNRQLDTQIMATLLDADGSRCGRSGEWVHDQITGVRGAGNDRPEQGERQLGRKALDPFLERAAHPGDLPHVIQQLALWIGSLVFVLRLSVAQPTDLRRADVEHEPLPILDQPEQGPRAA